MENFIKHIEKILKKDARLWSKDDDKKLLKNKLVEIVSNDDEALLELLLEDSEAKKHFFKVIKNSAIFLKDRFLQFVTMNEFLPDSFTAFENEIGLSDDKKLITQKDEISLIFPHKDCILEGGQTKEEAGREEIFYNTTLAPDEIDRIKEPKALVNWNKFDKDGKHEVKEISKQDNLVIKGNNLLALYSLLPKYRGEIKLIYIDPPYNTGNDSFGYNDKFNHSAWLTFMKNRLEIAKDLLREDGSIFISIDNNEVAYLQILMDEIFGVSNKKNLITVKRSAISGAKVINPGLVNISEFILVYCKDVKTWKVNRVFREKERDTRYSNYIVNFNKNYSDWKFCTVLEAWADNLKIEKNQLKKHFGDCYEEELEKFYYNNADKVFQFVTLDEKSVSDEVVKTKHRSIKEPSKIFHIKREDKNDYYIYNGKAILFLSNKLVEIDGKSVFSEPLSDIWNDVLPNDLHHEGGVSLKKGKKPEKLLQRILDVASNKNDIVLDFFAGAGTAGAVAHKMGRQYILIEQMDYIHDLPESRLINVINGDQTGISKAVNWKGGGSFVYAELLEWNQKYISQLEKAKTEKEVASIYKEIEKEQFYKYKYEPTKFDSKKFKELNLEEQKLALLDILDMNHLYVNKSSINDATFKVDEVDKKLTKMFYEEK